MPQFDTFIFSSSLFYLIISFFILLSLNFTRFLPRLSAILKLRHKIVNKPIILNDTKISFQDPLTIFGCNLTITDKNQ